MQGTMQVQPMGEARGIMRSALAVERAERAAVGAARRQARRAARRIAEAERRAVAVTDED